jgi:hypothetical protein
MRSKRLRSTDTVGSPEPKASSATVKKGQHMAEAQFPVSSPKVVMTSITTRTVISYVDSEEDEEEDSPPHKKKAVPAPAKKGTKKQGVDSPAASGSKGKKGDKGKAAGSDDEVTAPPMDLKELLKKIKLEQAHAEEMRTMRENNKQFVLQAELERERLAEQNEKDSKKIDKDSRQRKVAALAPGSSWKAQREATADWMGRYEDNGVGKDGEEKFNGMERFYDAQDYLKEQLNKMGMELAAVQRKSGAGYTDDFTKLLVENELGFDELNESEKQKIDKAAKEYFNRTRRKAQPLFTL